MAVGDIHDCFQFDAATGTRQAAGISSKTNTSFLSPKGFIKFLLNFHRTT